MGTGAAGTEETRPLEPWQLNPSQQPWQRAAGPRPGAGGDRRASRACDKYTSGTPPAGRSAWPAGLGRSRAPSAGWRGRRRPAAVWASAAARRRRRWTRRLAARGRRLFGEHGGPGGGVGVGHGDRRLVQFADRVELMVGGVVRGVGVLQEGSGSWAVSSAPAVPSIRAAHVGRPDEVLVARTGRIHGRLGGFRRRRPWPPRSWHRRAVARRGRASARPAPGPWPDRAAPAGRATWAVSSPTWVARALLAAAASLICWSDDFGGGSARTSSVGATKRVTAPRAPTTQ